MNSVTPSLFRMSFFLRPQPIQTSWELSIPWSRLLFASVFPLRWADWPKARQTIQLGNVFPECPPPQETHKFKLEQTMFYFKNFPPAQRLLCSTPTHSHHAMSPWAIKWSVQHPTVSHQLSQAHTLTLDYMSYSARTTSRLIRDKNFPSGI